MQQLTLEHFILKQRALNLYRQALRATKSIPDSRTRLETISWIREEFERNRHIHDVAVIQDKISSGRRELKQVFPGGNFTSP